MLSIIDGFKCERCSWYRSLTVPFTLITVNYLVNGRSLSLHQVVDERLCECVTTVSFLSTGQGNMAEKYNEQQLITACNCM